MAEQLKNTLAFNLAAGASAVLAHGLETAGGRPLAPDIIFNPSQYIGITADTANVTVTNNGAQPLSGTLLVEAWHTFERAFGDVNDEDLPVKPFIVVSGESALEAPILSLVYRPGATGAYAPGGNVFTDWYALMAAIKATKNLGYRQIQFDNRFAPNPNTDPTVAPFLPFNTVVPGPQLGLWPCAILPPPAGEAWDMTDVIWTDRGMAPGLDSTFVQIYDGGPGRPNHIDNLKRIDSMIFGIVYNGKTVGNHPFVTSRSTITPNAGPFYGWVFEGVRVRLYNTDASAQPVWISDAATSFFDIQNNAIFGLNPYAPAAPSPAPVIEIAAGATLVLFGKRTTGIYNNTFKGPFGANLSIDTYYSEVWGNAEDPMLQWVQPNFAGTIVPLKYECATQRFRPSSAAIVTPGGAAFFGEVCRADSSGGAVLVTLPKSQVTAPTLGSFPWEGTAITVLDYKGKADINAITVRAAVGDSINGVVELGGGESDTALPASAYSSLRFWPDGKGAWFTIA